MNTSRPDHEAALAGEPGQARVLLLPTVADHELLRCIGRGSYGEVWLGRNVLGEYRAVKIVYRQAFDQDRPFNREFEGIKKFEPISRSHPSQLNILHVGRSDAEGYFYYVMELADDATTERSDGPATERSDGVVEYWSNGKAPGVLKPASKPLTTTTPPLHHSITPSLQDPNSYLPRTLKLDLQRRGRLPVEECIELGLSLSTALAHLHGHGLIHRDVKPSNIIFVDGVPKLADIGLVTDVEATLSFVGTEGFIPPEGPVSVQADLYSLGKVLYETSMGRSRLDFPALPSNWDELPENEQARLLEFNEVLVKACESDPSRRYQSAQKMHQDLAVLQRGASVKKKHATERRLAITKRVAWGAAIVALIALSAFRLSLSFSRERGRPEAQAVGRNLTTNLDALNAYFLGRYAYNKRADTDMTNAVRFFERAIALDPNCAEAYAGLASSYTFLNAPRNFVKARAPAEKALALNPNLPEAHKCLALVKYMLDWHWAEAEEELKLAIRLDPRDGETLRAYGNYLKTMGRTKEAITVLTHAHELDPRAISITEILGEAFFAAGDYAQALKQYQTCLDAEPTHPVTREEIAKVYEEQGLFLKAIDLYQEDHLLCGEDQKEVARWCDALRNAYRTGGEKAYWRKSIEWAKEDPTYGPFDFAEFYARLGDKEATFQYLELAFQKRDVPLVQGLKTSRAFDKFRKEPEFIALLKKMKWE
jgi:serine/threonine protein kinase/Flp pilus assembly protein TadD